MSMRALLKAVRDRLRASAPGGLAYANSECEVGWDGQPPPMSGQVFAAVHPGSVQTTEIQGLSEGFEVDITLSLRAGQFPVDRWGERSVILATTGLYARAEAIRALVHMNSTLMTDANTTISAGENGFYHPLRFLGMSPPQEQGPDWWWADADRPGAPVGLSITLRFGDALRSQVIEEQS